MKTNTGKKPSHKDNSEPRRAKGKGAGGDSRKTRSPVPATQEVKAASGKQNNSRR